MPDYRAEARSAAGRHGVPPRMFERQIGVESDGYAQDVINCERDSPAGAQGIAQFMPDTSAWLGVDPCDPVAALDAAAGYLRRLYDTFGSWRLALASYNWGEGNVGDMEEGDTFPGETRRYLDLILGPGWPEPETNTMAPRLRTLEDLNLRESPSASSKILATVPKGSLVEPSDTRAWRRVTAQGVEGWMAADYLEDAPPTSEAAPEPPAPSGPVAVGLIYNPDFTLRLQIADYTCSIRSTQMALESVGVEVDINTLHDQMVPRYVNEDVGLKDGSGAGIRQVMLDHYGIISEVFSPATWQGVIEVAGHLPICLGGHGWGGVGHWVDVRRYQDGALELGNPAGTGPRFGQQRIDRGGWGSIAGWWSCVVITGRR